MGEDEGGAGLVSSLAGLLVVLVLLLFAVEALVGLYARSAVTGAAHDAARTLASDGSLRRGGAPEPDAVARADDDLRRALGGVGPDAETQWSVHDDQVVLEVRVPQPVFSPFRRPGGSPTIERTVRVRVERLR